MNPGGHRGLCPQKNGVQFFSHLVYLSPITIELILFINIIFYVLSLGVPTAVSIYKRRVRRPIYNMGGAVK